MKYVDTNILVRVITRDVPEQTDIAEEIIKTAASGELVVLDGVIQEACYVLEFNPQYRLPREVIFENLTKLLKYMAFKVSNTALKALEAFNKHPKLDFVDCLILVQSGYDRQNIASFDKNLLATLD